MVYNGATVTLSAIDTGSSIRPSGFELSTQLALPSSSILASIGESVLPETPTTTGYDSSSSPPTGELPFTTLDDNPLTTLGDISLTTLDSSWSRSSPKPTASPLTGFGGTNHSAFNTTSLDLSQEAVDALQLAQFIKNLGVALFSAENRTGGSLISTIASQEKTQQKALDDILISNDKSGVPPCKYLLPHTGAGTVSLMRKLKTMEVGALIFLTESLRADEDKSAAILLSSIATTSARQDTLLRAYAAHNVSISSFDTPLTSAWAYNIALRYIEPGSCITELPITILPELRMSNQTTGWAKPNTSILFTWDDAAQSSISRSGKPLFIGWVNQIGNPQYTSLNLTGSNRGVTIVPKGLSGAVFAVLTTQPGLNDVKDLSDATIAGPVHIEISPA